jgi:hypothetical protein
MARLRPRKAVLMYSSRPTASLSYAKVMDPPYPLVIVTNGDETRRLAAHTGAPWEPATPSEKEFAKLVEAASRVATEQLKEAVSTLMGADPAVWMQAARAASAKHIAELSGGWDEPHLPFVDDFLFPRKAAWATMKALRDGLRFVLIQGAPLGGKSNALREVTLRSMAAKDLAVLFVAADEGRGILQAIADLLASALSWPVTIDEARHWLRQISHAQGPALVLAIDGIGPDDQTTRRELEDLSSDIFGPQLRLVVTTDDAVVKKLMTHPKGLQASTIGRRIDAQIGLGLLDDGEFELAAKALWDRRMGLQHGAMTAVELRVPWMLRALGGRYAPSPEDPPDRAAMLPALLSLDMIGHARDRFVDPELRREFRELARGVLHDADDEELPLELKLEAMSTFVVRRSTLLRYMDRAEIDGLMARSFLKPAIHPSGEPVLFVRLPELLASEASQVLARALTERAAESAADAARWLASVTSRIPLGDVIAAHAFVDAAQSNKSVPLDAVRMLAEMPPRFEPISPGTRAAMHLDGVGVVDVTFEEDGSYTTEIDGEKHTIEADPDEPAGWLGDYHPWMILSHLAGQRIAYGDDSERLDFELLGLVGSCEHVLRRPDNFMQGDGVQTHSIPGKGEVVCHAAGIVEPITYSLFKMLSTEGPQQEEWIERALSTRSINLLARIDIALRETGKLLDPIRSTWAQRVRSERIAPALGEALECAAE